MAYKLTLLIGLTALMLVLNVGKARDCCPRSFWRFCELPSYPVPELCRCPGHPDIHCADWYGGCTCAGKRSFVEKASGLLEKLRGGHGDIAPEENAMPARGVDADKGLKMRVAEEARRLLKLLGGEQDGTAGEDINSPDNGNPAELDNVLA